MAPGVFTHLLVVHPAQENLPHLSVEQLYSSADATPGRRRQFHILKCFDYFFLYFYSLFLGLVIVGFYNPRVLNTSEIACPRARSTNRPITRPPQGRRTRPRELQHEGWPPPGPTQPFGGSIFLCFSFCCYKMGIVIVPISGFFCVD